MTIKRLFKRAQIYPVPLQFVNPIGAGLLTARTPESNSQLWGQGDNYPDTGGTVFMSSVYLWVLYNPGGENCKKTLLLWYIKVFPQNGFV
jgi:hypothetical protein